jgi:hypothetical protein
VFYEDFLWHCPSDDESFNRNIKANNNWKVLKLPVLIDRLSDMEQDQMTDIRASIHGRGSYQFTGQAQVLQIFIVVVLAFTTRFLCPGFRATLFYNGDS